MARKKHFSKAIGKYFFNIKMSYSNFIMISRRTKTAVMHAYSKYLNQREEVALLGKWDEKKFVKR